MNKFIDRLLNQPRSTLEDLLHLRRIDPMVANLLQAHMMGGDLMQCLLEIAVRQTAHKQYLTSILYSKKMSDAYEVGRMHPPEFIHKTGIIPQEEVGDLRRHARNEELKAMAQQELQRLQSDVWDFSHCPAPGYVGLNPSGDEADRPTCIDLRSK